MRAGYVYILLFLLCCGCFSEPHAVFADDSSKLQQLIADADLICAGIINKYKIVSRKTSKAESMDNWITAEFLSDHVIVGQVPRKGIDILLQKVGVSESKLPAGLLNSYIDNKRRLVFLRFADDDNLFYKLLNESHGMVLVGIHRPSPSFLVTRECNA